MRTQRACAHAHTKFMCMEIRESFIKSVQCALSVIAIITHRVCMLPVICVVCCCEELTSHIVV